MTGSTAGFALVLAALAAPLAAASAAGDREYGAYLSGQCVTCHRISGEAEGGVPPIVGLDADHFVAAMQAYRSGARASQIMQTLAAGLGDEEITALAAYFADVKPAR